MNRWASYKPAKKTRMHSGLDCAGKFDILFMTFCGAHTTWFHLGQPSRRFQLAYSRPNYQGNARILATVSHSHLRNYYRPAWYLSLQTLLPELRLWITKGWFPSMVPFLSPIQTTTSLSFQNFCSRKGSLNAVGRPTERLHLCQLRPEVDSCPRFLGL